MKNAAESCARNGILCIDKPGDHTSFDVIARVRGILKTRKVGHGGTLDPMATGVLPVFLGYATKCCDILPVSRKRYTAKVRLGIETDTQDITGQVVRESAARLSRAQLLEALNAFRGGYEQTPPMYSAVQVDGKRLYDLARQGMEVERAARPVTFYTLELLDFDGEAQTFTLDVECSKGTYIRTLCHDVARQAGTAGTLCALRRTMSAGFTLADCVTLEALTELASHGEEALQRVILPTGRAFDALPRVFLSAKQARMLKNGVKLDTARVRTQAAQGAVAVYGPEEEFLATAFADEAAGELTRVKLFCARD